MDDLIRRETVLRCIKESRENIDWGQSEDGDAFLHYSAALYRTIADKRYVPPVQPDHKTGHWLVKQDHSGSTYGECSQCHSIQYAGHTPYCPYCGSHNGGEQNE